MHIFGDLLLHYCRRAGASFPPAFARLAHENAVFVSRLTYALDKLLILLTSLR